MDHQKKLDFVLKMTRHGLDAVQHFDLGGTALPISPTSMNPAVGMAQPSVPLPQLSAASSIGAPGGSFGGVPSISNPLGGISGIIPAQNKMNTGGLGGGINNLLGTGNNFEATGANINAGTNAEQLQEAYDRTQRGLNQSEGLAGTLNPGISQGANTQDVLTGQLLAQSQGQGPNPAQLALNNATGKNIANQAALMAGQRGAGANVGLAAREAARQGATTQQEAAGQSAVLQAQQQLAAQNALKDVAANQVQQGTNAIQLQNQTGQNEQNILQGANTAANNANVSNQQNLNTVNAGVASENQKANQDVVGKLLGGIGDVLSFAKGGMVLPKHLHGMASIYHPHLAGGGMVWENSVPATAPISGGSAYTPAQSSSGGGSGGGSGDSMAAIAKIAPLLLAAHGGKVMKSGGKVPGKPKVDHDDYANDTVDAKLSPGEVVIDLNTMNDKGKLGKMARFVAQNIERKKMGRKL